MSRSYHPGDRERRALVAQPTTPRQEFAPHHFVLTAHRRKRRHLTLDGVQLQGEEGSDPQVPCWISSRAA